MKKMINEKDTIKYFDFLIRDLTTPTGFSVCNVLTENNHLQVNTPEQIDYFNDLEDALKEFGISKGYFENKGNNGWLKLTDKGIRLKDSKKGYLETVSRQEQDENANRKKLHNETRLSELKLKTFWFIFIFGLFGGIYSGISLKKDLTKSEEPKEDFVTKKQMELELSKMRTLFLNHKNNDVLPKTDSLNIIRSEIKTVTNTVIQ